MCHGIDYSMLDQSKTVTDWQKDGLCLIIVKGNQEKATIISNLQLWGFGDTAISVVFSTRFIELKGTVEEQRHDPMEDRFYLLSFYSLTYFM